MHTPGRGDAQIGDARRCEIIQIRKDFELARECHAQMYGYVEESQVQAMDNWEDILTNEFYDIEENVERSFFSPSRYPNTLTQRP